MEWSTDTETGCDDLEVYMEYGYVFVSSTGRNDVKMAAFSFKWPWVTMKRTKSLMPVMARLPLSRVSGPMMIEVTQ